MEMEERVVEQVDEMLTTVQAAKIVGLTPRRLRQLAVDGVIPATKVGRDWLMWLSDIARYQARKDAGEL